MWDGVSVAALAAGLAESADPSPSECPTRARHPPVSGSSPVVPDWAGTSLTTVVHGSPATPSPDGEPPGNIQTVHTRSTFTGFYPLERPLQVLSRQCRHQQHRPCAPGFMSRAACFGADRITRSFTALRPPAPLAQASDALLAASTWP